jgi:hypothetical protein
MDQQLSSQDIRALRTKGLIGESETAVRSGDLIIAENVITKQRRVLDTQGLILEGTRRVLKV